MTSRLFLSPPHMGTAERELLLSAFDSNWIAPLGPHVDAFEREFAEYVGARHAVAVSSGTAAIHLALLLHGVQPGDDVLVSTLTFSATVNPIRYVGANPVFVDSERVSWNMDPEILATELERRSRTGRRTAAVLVVHLYGQSADLDAIGDVCRRYGVPLIEDAAEALGSRYRGRHPGTDGAIGIFSFNGNKIITTSGGGMLVTADEDVAAHARKLATQARDPAPHYQHSEIGYNYRLSNLLAAVGRGQLAVLDARVASRRAVFDRYASAFASVPGLTMQPEAPWGLHSRWLSCVLVDPTTFGADREQVRLALEAHNIESRPLWKPMHQQPVFAAHTLIGNGVSDELFRLGLCLPSGSAMTQADQDRVIATVLDLHVA
jgi:pyridoxal phosphate-dependent aminotransferase EpsN